MKYLSKFKRLAPRYTATQEAAIDWLGAAHTRAEVASGRLLGQDEAERFHRQMVAKICRFGASPTQIFQRGYELEDFTHQDHTKMAVFSLLASPSGRGVGARMAFFENVVEQKFQAFYDGVATEPDAIIHVTCTGYVSPSGAQKLVAQRKWRSAVTHAYHMGCYAAIPAIRMAAGDTSTDIVHTEMCTIHLDPADHRPEQLVVQSLFADGFIKYSVTGSQPEGLSLRVRALGEHIIPQTADDMSWRVNDVGLQMTLARTVPDHIAREVRPFIGALADQAGVDSRVLLKSGHMAIHPGGPKIIERLAEVLQVEEAQIQASRQILQQHGNMSSATLPHIWDHLLAADMVKSGDLVLALAFGPGLTLCGAILEVCAS